MNQADPPKLAGETPLVIEPKPIVDPNAAKPPIDPNAKPPEAPKPGVVPEKYDFKIPEGFQANEEALGKASELFKSLNMDQTQAQSLLDFHASQIKAVAENAAKEAEKPYNEMVEMRKGWKAELAADKDIGPRLATVKQDFGKMLDAIGDKGVTDAFRAAMDLTGAGDHPAFVKFMDKLAPYVIEGKPMTNRAGGPSVHGQAAPGTRPASAAQALYPNLK